MQSAPAGYQHHHPQQFNNSFSADPNHQIDRSTSCMSTNNHRPYDEDNNSANQKAIMTCQSGEFQANNHHQRLSESLVVNLPLNGGSITAATNTNQSRWCNIKTESVYLSPANNNYIISPEISNTFTNNINSNHLTGRTDQPDYYTDNLNGAQTQYAHTNSTSSAANTDYNYTTYQHPRLQNNRNSGWHLDGNANADESFNGVHTYGYYDENQFQNQQHQEQIQDKFHTYYHHGCHQQTTAHYTAEQYGARFYTCATSTNNQATTNHYSTSNTQLTTSATTDQSKVTNQKSLDTSCQDAIDRGRQHYVSIGNNQMAVATDDVPPSLQQAWLSQVGSPSSLCNPRDVTSSDVTSGQLETGLQESVKQVEQSWAPISQPIGALQQNKQQEFERKDQQQQQQQFSRLSTTSLTKSQAIKQSSSTGGSSCSVGLIPSLQRTNQCGVCGRNYARPSTLKTHLRTHTNERPFKCNVCFKTFSQAANLTAHQRVHTGEVLNNTLDRFFETRL